MPPLMDDHVIMDEHVRRRAWLVTQYRRGVRTTHRVPTPELCLRVPDTVASTALPVYTEERNWPALTYTSPAAGPPWPLDPCVVAAHALARPTVAGYKETVCAFHRGVTYFEIACPCARSHEGMRWLLGALEHAPPPAWHPGVGRDGTMWALVHYTACLGSPSQLDRLLSNFATNGVPVADLLTCLCGLGSILQVAGFALGFNERLTRWSLGDPCMASAARRADLTDVIVRATLRGDEPPATQVQLRRQVLDAPVPLSSLSFCGTPVHVALAFGHGAPVGGVLLDAGASIESINTEILKCPGANYHHGPSQEAACYRPEDLAVVLSGFRDGSSWMCSAAILQDRVRRKDRYTHFGLLFQLPMEVYLDVLSYLIQDPKWTFGSPQGNRRQDPWSTNYSRYRSLYLWWSTFTHENTSTWAKQCQIWPHWLPDSLVRGPFFPATPKPPQDVLTWLSPY